MLPIEKQDEGRHPATLITASQVRAIFGGISDMTLWRWLADGDLAFPRPIVIQRTRYWTEADLLAWIAAREAA